MTDEVPGKRSRAERLRAGVAAANVPTLLMVLVQLTGNLSWLTEFPTSRVSGMGDNDSGGHSPEDQERIRSAALKAILDWDSGKPLAIPEPSDELLVEMLSTSIGESIPAEYGPMLAALAGRASLLPESPVPAEAAEELRVLIVGSGLSGLCAAVYLRKLGIPFTIVERHSDLGGTWHENGYPGVGVDTPNHLYSFSFATYDWNHFFAKGDELRDYLATIADQFDLVRHIRFATNLVRAEYDERAQSWRVELESAKDGRETIRVPVLISAVGIFNPPVWPKLEGLDTFEGPVVHTADWPAALDLDGKRVAVIGTGASAMQLVPAIADEVERVTVFQRSKQWIAPFDQLNRRVAEDLRYLFREVPLYREWYRLRLGWTWNDRLHGTLQVDPDWPHLRSINAVNDGHRRYFTRYIVRKLAGHEQLIADVLPDYPPFGKRMLLDHGWLDAIKRDNVDLIVDPIARVRPGSVVTRSGHSFPVDAIALATGFDVIRFLPSLDLVGRGGQRLSDLWGNDNAQAYLGTTVPGFPNLFVLYGPNLQPGHGGSIMLSIEMQMRYITSLLRTMSERRIAVVECKDEVHRKYNEDVDSAHRKMVWAHPGMHTYTRNAAGRQVANSPWTNLQFWHLTEEANLADFTIEPRRDGKVAAVGSVTAGRT